MRPLVDVAKASQSTSTPLTIPVRLQAKARQQTPMMTPPSGTRARLGRTWLSRAASIEPMATPIAKTSMKSVLTFSMPPMTWVTTGASSDSVTAPASQNQQTINVPSQMRLSVLVSRISASVEVQGLRVIARSGADEGERGMARDESQQATAMTMIATTTMMGD